MHFSPNTNVAEFNRKFQVQAAQRGTAFLPCPRRNLDLIFSQCSERTVDKDNTVSFRNPVLQIEPAEWGGTMAGCKVIVHQHLDETITLTIGAHRVGHYSGQGKLLTPCAQNLIFTDASSTRELATPLTLPTPLPRVPVILPRFDPRVPFGWPNAGVLVMSKASKRASSEEDSW
jgi:hypothetical protein